jgi:hypothetical protein
VLCDALFEEDKQTIFEALCFALNEDSAMEFGQVYLKLAEASKKMGYIGECQCWWKRVSGKYNDTVADAVRWGCDHTLLENNGFLVNLGIPMELLRNSPDSGVFSTDWMEQHGFAELGEMVLRKFFKIYLLENEGLGTAFMVPQSVSENKVMKRLASTGNHTSTGPHWMRDLFLFSDHVPADIEVQIEQYELECVCDRFYPTYFTWCADKVNVWMASERGEAVASFTKEQILTMLDSAMLSFIRQFPKGETDWLVHQGKEEEIRRLIAVSDKEMVVKAAAKEAAKEAAEEVHAAEMRRLIALKRAVKEASKEAAKALPPRIYSQSPGLIVGRREKEHNFLGGDAAVGEPIGGHLVPEGGAVALRSRHDAEHGAVCGDAERQGIAEGRCSAHFSARPFSSSSELGRPCRCDRNKGRVGACLHGVQPR